MAGNLTAMIAAAFSGGAAPPVTSDPYFEYTTLLLPGNGTNGAQNNTFLDGSTNNFTITRNGNTTQGTFSPFSQTGWGNYFPGTDPEAAIETSVSSKFAFGGNWTAELWYYPVERTGVYPVVFSIIDSSYATGFAFFDRHAGASSVFKFEGFSTSHNLNTVVQNNTWYHIALSYNGSVLSFYINGVLDSTLTVSIGSSNRALMIGRNYDSASYNESIKAYISNFRVISGQNLYTGTFTPSTTPLTATTVGSTGAGAASTITGTVQFLGCQSNRFVDNSPTPSSLTISNNPSVIAFSPFNPSASWSAATYGGSGYFDGSGDYLSVPDNAAFTMGSGDFTIEFWAYTTTTNNQTVIIQIDSGGSTSALSFGVQINTSKWRGILASGTTFYACTASANAIANQWNHIAFVRNGNTGTLYINGTADGTVSLTGVTINDSSQVVAIGGEISGSNMITGYISNARIVKGTAVYTSNFTPPTAPLTAITNTSLLLNFTNAGIYDATSKNDLETVGNAQISTAQSKWGGSSMYFDGTGDWLQAPTSSLLNFGSAPYTIEFWYRPNEVSNDVSLIGKYSTSFEWVIQYLPSVSNSFRVAVNNNQVSDFSSALSANTWYHIALCRDSSGNLRFFRDGNQVGSTVTSGTGAARNITATNDYLTVGVRGAGTQPVNGYIQDVRITTGVARYTANFTAPTSAFPTL